jgi:hypothetical protein
VVPVLGFSWLLVGDDAPVSISCVADGGAIVWVCLNGVELIRKRGRSVRREWGCLRWEVKEVFISDR